MQKIPPSSFALIIGAMKSGTTFLYQHVQRHPRICPCWVKEPEFFSEHQEHEVNVERYEELWDYDPNKHKYCLEASTGYTKYPTEQNVPAKIFDYPLRPKFIYIVRNPIDRIASQYNYIRLHRPYEGLENPMQDWIISRSQYFLQLRQYLEYFPDKRDYLILDFEKVKHAPDDLINEVFEFLNVESSAATDGYEVVHKSLNRTKLEQLLRSFRAMRLIRKMVPGRLIDKARKAMFRVSDSAERQFNDEEKEFLREQLHDDMKHFQEEFGFDVGKWGF